MDYMICKETILFVLVILLCIGGYMAATWDDHSKSVKFVTTFIAVLLLSCLVAVSLHDYCNTDSYSGFSEKEYKGHLYLFYGGQYIGPVLETKSYGGAADSIHTPSSPDIKEYYYEY